MSQHSATIVQHSLTWAKHFSMAMVSSTPRDLSPIAKTAYMWCPPPLRWVCLNTDGSIYSSTYYARQSQKSRPAMHIGVLLHSSKAFFRYVNMHGLKESCSRSSNQAHFLFLV
ncbi:hypothetical protein V6N13_106817 [Hibiscus sabdariffa]